MTRSTSLSLRVVGTIVAAAIVVLGMPTPPASAAPLDHVTITANTPTHVEGNSGTTAVTFAIAYTGQPQCVLDRLGDRERNRDRRERLRRRRRHGELQRDRVRTRRRPPPC